MQAIGGGVANSGGIEESINAEGIVNAGGGTDNAFKAYLNNTGGTDVTFRVSVVCIQGSVTG
jgi:hypothetical protein